MGKKKTKTNKIATLQGKIFARREATFGKGKNRNESVVALESECWGGGGKK